MCWDEVLNIKHAHLVCLEAIRADVGHTFLILAPTDLQPYNSTGHAGALCGFEAWGCGGPEWGNERSGAGAEDNASLVWAGSMPPALIAKVVKCDICAACPFKLQLLVHRASKCHSSLAYSEATQEHCMGFGMLNCDIIAVLEPFML